jgi:hypothetical protein
MKNSETRQKILKSVAPVVLAVTLVFGAYAADGSNLVVSDKNGFKTEKPESHNNINDAESDSGKVIVKESSSEGSLYLEEALEEEIMIEDWMLNANDEFWTSAKKENDVEEEELTVEDWMIDLDYWQ